MSLKRHCATRGFSTPETLIADCSVKTRLGKPKPRIDFPVFAVTYLNLKLYGWQERILAALQATRVSAVVCNGGGKSSVIISSAILAFLYNWPRGRVAVTSGSYLQLNSILWPAIEQYRGLEYFKGWIWNQSEIRTPQGGGAIGFSTDDPKRLEGWHEDLPNQSPLLYIVDEAKSVSDDKYQGIGRCTPTFYGQFSSAGVSEGEFYYSFNRYKRFFWTSKITSRDCPHISEQQRAFDKARYPQTYAQKHDSEFDSDIGGAAIKLGIIQDALQRQSSYEWHRGQRTAFCDFAAGGAENVIALKDGNKVEIVAAWVNSDPTQACREFVQHFKRLKLQPSEIFGDVGGMGVVMCSNLKSMGWPINEVNNGLPADEPEHYANRGSEIWYKAADIIEHGIGNGQYMIIPDDVEFIRQATTRKREYDARQRLKIESKKDLVPRVGKSPDRADAVLGAMVCRPSQWNPQLVSQVYMKPNMFHTPWVHF